MNPPIFKTTAELRAHLLPLRTGKIALVPTMGALHEGHLELVRRAQAAAEHVVVYIFVNPAQFAPHEDFDSYPRDLMRDAGAIADLGFSNISIFAPDVTEIYPAPSSTQIELGDIATRFEGAARPGHFAGVALVLSKFFHLVQPDMAFFGEKDFQQLQVVRQFTRDLFFPLEVVGVPIVREPSGLAMSSRNVYLTDEQRNVIAPKLYAALQAAALEIHAGKDIETVIGYHTKALLDAAFEAVDYLAYVDAKTLTSLFRHSNSEARLLVVARLGKVRLLDNILVD